MRMLFRSTPAYLNIPIFVFVYIEYDFPRKEFCMSNSGSFEIFFLEAITMIFLIKKQIFC